MTGLLSGLNSALVREEALRLSSHCTPCNAGIIRDVNGGTFVRSSDENAGCGAVQSSGGLVEGDKCHALNVAVVRIADRASAVRANASERSHFGEGGTSVSTPPETVPASGSKVENVVVLGVESKPLSRAACWHVAAHLGSFVSLAAKFPWPRPSPYLEW